METILVMLLDEIIQQKVAAYFVENFVRELISSFVEFQSHNYIFIN